MIWYLLNIFILTIAYLWPSKLEVSDPIDSAVSQSTRKRVCIIGSVGWIILSGLRHYSIGDDTQSYGVRFESGSSSSWNDLFENLYEKYILGVEHKDPGFFILQKFVSVFTKEYQVFLILIAVLFFVSMGVVIYKFSRNPYVSYVLFSTLFYSFFAITGNRQTIATAIALFLGYFLIKKRKFIPFVITVLLASTIHASAVAIMPFYFISRIKINKGTLVGYIAAIILAFMFRYQLLDILKFMAGYDSYTDDETAAAGTFIYLLLAIGLFVIVFHKRLLETNTEVVNVSINAVLVACAFSSLLLINPAFMRVVQYYSLFLLFLLPEMVKILPKKNDQKILTMIIVGMLIGLFVVTGANVTYKFFWQ